MQKPALLFSLDILDRVLLFGEKQGVAVEMFSFYSWVIFSNLQNFHSLCRENLQRLLVRSGHLLYVVFLTWDPDLSFVEERCLSMRTASTAHHDGVWALWFWGYLLDRVAWASPSQNDMSSGSKEATAGGFVMNDFIFDLNYTISSLFSRVTEIIHLLLNLRVSSKGRGSARSASPSVSWTQSPESQGKVTVTRSDMTLFPSAQSFLRQRD